MTGNAEDRVHESVERLLFERWDPLGAREHPGWPRDEYGGYVEGIIAVVRHHVSDEVLAEHLGWIEEAWMGLVRSPLRHRIAVATAIRQVVAAHTSR